MARKSVTSSRSKTKATPARKRADRVSRDRVITFRISEEEATLIAKASDRIPLARYSRDTVLARAATDANK